MIVAKWREGFSFYKGIDAQKVADEITGIGDKPTPPEIVERARDENSELHKCFEWDDSAAAEKYRLVQARYVVHHLVIQERVIPQERPEIRFFYKTGKNENDGYSPTMIIVSDEDKHAQLLKQALAELRAFKIKYSCLQELSEIFALID